MRDQRFDDEIIVAFVLDELPPDEAAELEAAAASSAGLARAITRLQELVDTMRTDDSEAPTRRAVDLAQRAVRQELETARGPGSLERLVHHIAEVVFDSRARLSLAGYRSGAAAYQLAYSCDAARVDLGVSATSLVETERTIRGRVATRDGSSPGAIALRSAETDALVAETRADDEGRFVIQAAPGNYVLVVDLGKETMTTKSIVFD